VKVTRTQMTTTVERVQSLSAFPRAARISDAVSTVVLRYGLVLFLLGGGLSKFTQDEALMIQPWVAHSPFLGWLYSVTDVRGASILIGVIEVIISVLLALRHWWPHVSFVGSLAASIQFVITFSFLFTTPGLSPETQGFLMKDLILFGSRSPSATAPARSVNLDSSRHVSVLPRLSG
jgi:reactive chlorine resistance protein C